MSGLRDLAGVEDQWAWTSRPERKPEWENIKNIGGVIMFKNSVIFDSYFDTANICISC